MLHVRMKRNTAEILPYALYVWNRTLSFLWSPFMRKQSILLSICWMLKYRKYARLFHFKYWSVCTVRTMFRTLSWFFAALLFSVHCLQRQFWYSRLYKEVTNSSLAILYGDDCSLVHCAGLCSGDDYCMEFLYSEISRHCIGLHCVKKDNYLYQYMGPESSHMLRYEKGNLSCLNKNTFRW